MPINYNLPGAYQQQQLDAENAYQQALTGIAQKQASLAHDTGFTYNQQDDGSVKDVQIDPNNQYSSVMGLLGAHADNLHSLRDSLSRRGLNTNTGLAAKRAALLKFAQTRETSGLGASFANKLAGLQGDRANALTSRNNAFTGAEQAALLYALQQQQFTAAAGGAGTPGSQIASYDGNPGNGATPGYGGGATVYGDPSRPSFQFNGKNVAPITYNSVGATPDAIGPVGPGKAAPGIKLVQPGTAQGKLITTVKSAVNPRQGQVNRNQIGY